MADHEHSLLSQHSWRMTTLEDRLPCSQHLGKSYSKELRQYKFYMQRCILHAQIHQWCTLVSKAQHRCMHVC